MKVVLVLKEMKECVERHADADGEEEKKPKLHG